MLTTLRIKNLALVADLTLELRPGYNVITGETGAGKSILIGGLNLVLGQRADRNSIRSGSESCSVEAVFEIGNLKSRLNALLDESGLEPCNEDGIILKRTFSQTGTNRQFVNGSPATLQVLQQIGEWLVDIHGPHDHQSLLHTTRQLEVVDAFGSLQPQRERFAELLRRRHGLEAEKRALIVDEKTFAQQLDLLRFQVNEITSAHLADTDEAELQEEFRRASNAARLLQLSQTILSLLAEEEHSVLAQAARLGRTLQELQKVDSGTSAFMELHENALSSLQDLQRQLVTYADGLEIDPAQYQELEDRLNLIQGLKRKYGSSLADVIAFGVGARAKMTSLEQRDTELIRLNLALEQNQKELQRAGEDLTKQRLKVLPKLSKVVSKQLADLGFRQSHFDIALTGIGSDPKTAGAWSPSGMDAIEFLFAPNPGETPRPLRAIASSGELARVMLALKTVLADEDAVPVLVFDEVDANIGGETARAVGEKMCQIAKQHQVVCITHLAAVAAPAHAHFVVSKETQQGRTLTQLQLLKGPARITELARMLGGQSEAARKHAEELLR